MNSAMRSPLIAVGVLRTGGVAPPTSGLGSGSRLTRSAQRRTYDPFLGRTNRDLGGMRGEGAKLASDVACAGRAGHATASAAVAICDQSDADIPCAARKLESVA